MNKADDLPPRRVDDHLRAELTNMCEAAIGLSAAYSACGMEQAADHWASKAFELRDAGFFDIWRVPPPDMPMPRYRQRARRRSPSRPTSRSAGSARSKGRAGRSSIGGEG